MNTRNEAGRIGALLFAMIGPGMALLLSAAASPAAPPPAHSPLAASLAPAEGPEALARPLAQVAVTWEPERPVQGHLFRVRVTGTEGPLVGEVAGERLHFERTAPGVFESLAAVPIDAAGTVAAEITVRDAVGRETTHTPTIPVATGSYRHEKLRVAPQFGAPLDSARQARLNRDIAKARAVSELAHNTLRIHTNSAELPRATRVTSGFGHGREFNGRVSSRHMGLDLAGRPGDPVRAAARGVVALVDTFLLAGRIVYLNHGAGLVSGYFHLTTPRVAVGDTVNAGDVVGTVGATGRVTGPHLHWVVRYGQTSVDPRSLLDVLPTP